MKSRQVGMTQFIDTAIECSFYMFPEEAWYNGKLLEVHIDTHGTTWFKADNGYMYKYCTLRTQYENHFGSVGLELKQDMFKEFTCIFTMKNGFPHVCESVLVVELKETKKHSDEFTSVYDALYAEFGSDTNINAYLADITHVIVDTAHE